MMNEFIDVSVDCVVFGFTDDRLQVLLIEQKSQGDNNKVNKRLALPGDLIYRSEGLDEAAQRVLHELTNLKNVYMKQLGAFGDPDRVLGEEDQQWLRSIRTNPDARVITVAYYSLVRLEMFDPKPSSFAEEAVWVPIADVPKLAFDHSKILNKALAELRDQIESHPVSFELLPKKFSLSQLQQLHEIVLDTKLDKRNFRRKVQKLDALVALDEKQQGVLHKPARLFTYNKKYND